MYFGNERYELIGRDLMASHIAADDLHDPIEIYRYRRVFGQCVSRSNAVHRQNCGHDINHPRLGRPRQLFLFTQISVGALSALARADGGIGRLRSWSTRFL
jgi:hypothetical protein